MPANSFGEIFRITTFGESHGLAVGVVVDGCPAGLELSESDIQPDMDRRKPGQSKITTQRKESDTIKILSGVFEGKTTGSPIMMMVTNDDQRSGDYDTMKDLFRPSHADYTYTEKYGHRDHRGGGRSSARIMIGRVAAGAIAKKYLKEKCGMEFLAFTQSVGEVALDTSGISDLTKFELETDRLKLVTVSYEFANEIFTEFTSEIAKYIPVKSATKLSETLEFIHRSLEEIKHNSGLIVTVLDKNTGEYLGQGGIHNLDKDTIDFGLWIKKSAQQKGYGKELILGLKTWAEQNLPNKKMIYRVDKANLGSQKIALSLGGKLVKEYSEDNLELGKSFNWQVYEMGTTPNAETYLEKITLADIESNIVRCPDGETAEKMIRLIEKVRSDGDSVGGVIQGLVRNVPVGLGEPEFDKLPALLAHAMMSINATKGFEIGSGFSGSKLRGSQHNDEFYTDENGQVKTRSNHAGGTLGGISSGQTIDFKVAIKPVATIGKTQSTVDKEGNQVEFEGKGRHDPCVLPRAVPIVEAMAALVIMDLYLRQQKSL